MLEKNLQTQDSWEQNTNEVSVVAKGVLYHLDTEIPHALSIDMWLNMYQR